MKLKTAASLTDAVSWWFVPTNPVEGVSAGWMVKVVAGGGAVACKMKRWLGSSCDAAAGDTLSAFFSASKESARPLDSKTRNRPSVIAPRTLYSPKSTPTFRRGQWVTCLESILDDQ